MISFKAIGGTSKGATSVGDATRYFDKSFQADGPTHNVDNYYSNELAQATWQGKAAALLGMEGKVVTKDEFAKALRGQLVNQQTGEVIDLAKSSSKERRAGYDFTFAPPKSVSIVALVGQDQRVIDACVRANARAMAWLEQNGAYVRVKVAGKNKMMPTGNLLYATVGHETNRENEPHLHFHNVVDAVTYDADRGAWRSLTNDVMLKIRKDMDAVATMDLARSLKALGYNIEFDNKGKFEIVEITRGQIEALSTRSVEMRKLLKSWGIKPEQANHEERQDAILASRKGKQWFPRDVLYASWEKRAADIGLDVKTIVANAMARSVELDGGRAPEAAISPSHLANLPATYGEVMRPLEVERLSPSLLEVYRVNPEVRELVHLYDTVGRAEKVSSWVQWTPEQTAAYNAGDTALFSRLRGYSEGEIADFQRLMTLHDQVQATQRDPNFVADLCAELDSLVATPQLDELERKLYHMSESAESRAAGDDIQAAPVHTFASTDRSMVGGALAPSEEMAQKQALQAVAWAVEHLANREQAFSRPALEAAALRFTRDRFGIDGIQWAVDQTIKEKVLTGRVMENGEVWLTTNKAIDIETRLRNNIVAGQGNGRVIMTDPAEFDAALKRFEDRKSTELGKRYRLSDEQVIAARNVLMHPDAFQGIQGDAGTGKTAVGEFIKEAAEGKGWIVMGMATTATATKGLEASSGIASQTVAAYLYNRQNAMALLQTEIANLRKKLESHEQQLVGGRSGLEAATLHAASLDNSFGQHRYVFDHLKGEVYRSPDTWMHMLGERLVLGADARSQQLAAAAQTTASLIDSLRLRSQGAVNDMRAALGRKLTRYETVGTVEAIAARSALYTQREAEHNALLRVHEQKTAELANVERTGNREGRNTLILTDEASLTGGADTLKITDLARLIGSRNVFQGDIKQHQSVAALAAFEQMQRCGLHTSTLTETRRFDNATEQTKEAIALKTRKQYSAAVARLDHREVPEQDLARVTAERYLTNYQELAARGVEKPTVGVVVLTNDDRKAINAEIHGLLATNGLIGATEFKKEHLDDPKLTPAETRHLSALADSHVDRLIFHKPYRKLGIENSDVVKVLGFDYKTNRIQAERTDGTVIWINPERQDQYSAARAEERMYSQGDQVEARANIKDAAVPDSKLKERITNGTRGVIVGIDEQHIVVEWADGVRSKLTNDQARFIDFAYAHTTFKEQYATNDRELLAAGQTGAKIFNRHACEVAITRARDNTEIITSDYDKLVKNAGRDVSKTTAVDWENRQSQSRREQQVDMGAALDRGLSGARPGIEPRREQERGQVQDHTLDQTPERGRDQKQEQGRQLGI